MAEAFVREAKFAPVGMRGMGRGSDSDYLAEGLEAYLEHANRETFLGVQIEDAEAIEHIEAIAAPAGIDLLVQRTENGQLMKVSGPNIYSYLIAWHYDTGKATVKIVGP